MARLHTQVRRALAGAAAIAWISALIFGPFPLRVAQAQEQASGHSAEARNMRLVGAHDLQARSAYQPVIHEQNGRWIAYIGHHGGSALNPLTGVQEASGTSIVDVSDPRRPQYLHHIPGERAEGELGGAQMVCVCDGKTLPKGDPHKTYLLRTFGTSAHEMWDVTSPEKPVLVTTIADHLKSTHKNWWECDTGIAYLVSTVPEWRSRRVTQVYDLSDPAKPVFIRNFGQAGQQPGAIGPVPTEVHGPISAGPAHNRVYFGHGINKNGVLQIVDRKKLLEGPKEPTPENLLYPQVSRLDFSSMAGAHTTLPVLDVEVPEFAKDKEGKMRDFVIVVGESGANECQESRQMVYVVDVTDESRPLPVANFNVPEATGHFCSRGGRFGSHSANEQITPIYHKRIVFIAWFNAGVRAVDIRDPYRPHEIGYYIPATTAKTDRRCVNVDNAERCKVAIQTNNVEADHRGYIYIVDRANTGMHILELTGEARQIANFPR